MQQLKNTGEWLKEKNFFIREAGKVVKWSQVEALFDFFEDSDQFVLFIKDINHVYVRVNKEYVNMTGKPYEAIIGKTDYDLFNVKTAKHFSKMDQMVMDEFKSFQLEEYIYYPNGDKKYFETVKLPLVNDDNQLIGIIGMSQNIDDKKEIFERHLYSENYLRLLIQGMELGLAVYEIQKNSLGQVEDYKFIEANPAYLKIIKRTEEEVIGSTVKELFPKEADYWIEELTKICLLGGSLKYESYAKEYDKTFSVYSFSPQDNQLAILVHDITDQRMYEAQIISEKERAEELNLAKELFLTNISHEIRTPINGIVGLTELLKQSELNEEQKVHVNMLEHSVEALMELIEDIMDYSMLIKKRTDLQIVSFDLRELIREVISLYEYAANQKGLKITVHFEAHKTNYFEGDRIKLRQVISQLLSNAIKYTHLGKVDLLIGFKAEVDSIQDISITVKDTGIGISKQQQQRLFHQIEQGDSTHKKKYSGIGIGLVTVVELLGLMNGQIEVESTVGLGSIFKVTLPMKPVFHKESSILLVEDDHASAVFTEMILKHLGYAVVTCSTGEEALDIVRHQAISLVLIDLQLPSKNGFEVALEMKQAAVRDSSRIPIIAVTGFNSDQNRLKASEVGMEAFITKPIDLQMIKTVLAQYLPST